MFLACLQLLLKVLNLTVLLIRLNSTRVLLVPYYRSNKLPASKENLLMNTHLTRK